MDYCRTCKRMVQAAVKCFICGTVLLGAVMHCEPPHIHPDYRATQVVQQQVIMSSFTTTSSSG